MNLWLVRVKGKVEYSWMWILIFLVIFLASTLALVDRSLNKNFNNLNFHNIDLTKIINNKFIISDNERLIAKIKSEANYPKNNDNRNLAIYLLDWASNHANFALSPKLEETSSRDFPKLTVAQIQSTYFDINCGGGYCSATSVYFSKLLRAFSFDAFTISFGIPDTLMTHVTVIWREKETGYFYILDPTFNAHFTDNKGNLISLYEQIIKDKSRWNYSQGNLSNRHFLYYDGDSIGETLAKRQSMICFKHPSKEDPQIWVCTKKDYGIETYFKLFYKDFIKYSIPMDKTALIVLLQKGIFDIGSTRNPSTRNEFISLLNKLNIKIHSDKRAIHLAPVIRFHGDRQ